MHDQPTHGPCRGPLPDEDRQVQGVVLTHLLDAAPAQFTVSELLRELADDPESFPERDPILRAVRDLSHAGLVHRHGDFVFPTRAAIHHGALRIA